MNPILYSAFLLFGAGGKGPCLLSPSCHQKFKRMEPDSIHKLGESPGLAGGREGDWGEKAIIPSWPRRKKGGSRGWKGWGGCYWSGFLGKAPEIWRHPSLLDLNSLFPCFQFLLEMEGAAAGADLGLFRCLLCAWETPSRLAVLQHLRAPAHRDAQAQRRLQLLQSGPAAEEGLSALQSILSFSHGQLRTSGEEEGTREEGLGREGGWFGS